MWTETETAGYLCLLRKNARDRASYLPEALRKTAAVMWAVAVTGTKRAAAAQEVWTFAKR